MAAKAEFLSLNGNVVRWDDAKVHIQAPIVRYGAGVFEGIRGYWSEKRKDILIFRLREHLRRLARSMEIMRFDHRLSDEMFHRGLIDVIDANKFAENIHIRLIAFVDGDGSQWATGPIGWSIAALPAPQREQVRAGIHCGISSWQRINDNAMPPRAKVCANYNNGRLAGIQGTLDGYQNVLLLTQHGHIAESPMSCFFMVRDGVLVTPLATDAILEGITRETVIQIARDILKVEVVERSIERTEAYCADEAFLCGSGQEIVPILSIDRHPLGDGAIGELTRKLQEVYFSVVRGETPGYEHWLTPVFDAKGGLKGRN